MFFVSVPWFRTSRARSPLLPDTPLLQTDLSSCSRTETLWWQEEHPHAPALYCPNRHHATCITRLINKASETSFMLKSAALTIEDDQSEDSNIEPDDSKIPKPTGEAGRPGRGGYNLEQALSLNTRDYKKIKIAKHLNQTQCISKQERRAIRIVERQAVLEFPELDDYDKLWPVTDLIKLRLKYTAARCKRQGRGPCSS